MISRRDFLKAAVLATAAPALILPETTFAGLAPWQHMKDMPLHLFRNGEEFMLNLRQNGHFGSFRYATRDLKANVIGYPDPELAGLLSWIQAVVAIKKGKWYPFHITSGLRTKDTNNKTEGAARNSMHLPDKNGVFRAVDLYAPGISPKEIASLAKVAREGGVGLYSSRGFIHIDTGKVRAWGK